MFIFEDKELLTKFNINPRKHKKKHLWLWGPSSMGKTTRFLNPLMNHFDHYCIPKDKTFWEKFDPEIDYKFFYVDEYNQNLSKEKKKSISELNELCNPTEPDSEIGFRYRGGTWTKKRGNNI